VSFGVEVTDAACAEALMYRCLGEGLSFKVGGGNVLTLCPPLTISQTELDAAFDILDRAIQSDARGK
jgi:4-aminobutyrate aminotransferase